MQETLLLVQDTEKLCLTLKGMNLRDPDLENSLHQTARACTTAVDECAKAIDRQQLTSQETSHLEAVINEARRLTSETLALANRTMDEAAKAHELNVARVAQQETYPSDIYDGTAILSERRNQNTSEGASPRRQISIWNLREEAQEVLLPAWNSFLRDCLTLEASTCEGLVDRRDIEKQFETNINACL
jgi:hypothetical protein